MIFTNKTITFNNTQCEIDSPIVLYRGDFNVEVRFRIVSAPYTYGNSQELNVIEQTEASYGQLVIKTPNSKAPIFSTVTPVKRGSIIFTITAEMIDEITEVGYYTFQIRLLDANKESRATIPEVENGIEIREPIASEDVTDTKGVGLATVGYALSSTSSETLDTFDEDGNYIQTNWSTGDRITAERLNKIEAGIDTAHKKATNIDASSISITDANDNYNSDNVEGALNEICIKVKNTAHTHNNKTVLDNITANKISEWDNKSNFSGSYNDLTNKPTIPTKTSQLTNDSGYATQTFVNNKIAEAALNSGEVDLSNYVTKELGNASQITFTDGQTFQAKLDAGTLKGAKGDTGAKGQDGLTTKISMNGTTYTHVGGTITLPNCATQSYVIDKINEALSQGGGNNGNISVSYDEVNEELTFGGTTSDAYDENEESLTIGGIVN